jgi:hypothetical protein
MGRLARCSVTAFNSKKFRAKENEKLLTPFAILQMKVDIRLLGRRARSA